MKQRDRRLEYISVVKPILQFINNIPDGKAINIHGSIFCERGTPDIIGSIKGRTVCFECKRDIKANPEDIQQWRLAEWLKAGAIVGVVSDLWQVQMILCLMGVI